ncbi:MAG TPA: YbjN domain-containing protein [Candidatus Limnocylindrales bacterium]|nr:YbjN domain-containing protein [Candidatus Limnocylindrales bacterium]
MPSADQATVRPADVERWLDELGVTPDARSDREGVSSWDLRLDGRRRFDLPITLILDPDLALICWVHYAPPIGDAFRKSYRRLLRWNDEFPFAKFSLAEDERPILASELPIRTLDRDELGLALARSLAISDRLLEESASWIWIGGTVPPVAGRRSRGAHLIDRYADRMGELLDSGVTAEPAATAEPASTATTAGPAAPGDAEEPAATAEPKPAGR